MATLGMSEADKLAVEAFRRDVVEPSRTQLVIVDFWAEWCGPCKQLTPIIEKVCADYAAKGVKLVKVNVDENGFIASQFRVQSIPTVYAVFQGQPVADLSQARTEGQLKQYLDQLLGQLPIESEEKAQELEIAPLIAMAEETLAAGDAERALSIFAQIADMVPGHADVASGQARALVAMGQLDEADAVLDALPADAAKDQAVDRARAAIALARDAKPVADLSGLEAKVAADPDDHAARFELAGGLMANGDRDGAAEALLEIVRRDRAWNDSAARTQLLTLFEAVGLEDPWVSAQRRKLSQILFA
ncbi:MAG: tetratricopeptide repeat protein [Pseudomonadota bacterium]|uniref:Thioredoxin n=2 Tax=Sphingobium xenophagum TaxID=121428 RepID=A0A401IXU9_SPHXE|nr:MULTISPECIES: tetratricopeptide repeat protein [Sphingobium]MBG6118855.1 putative thioredoxin [Sphingobium sp. JAI105]MBU0659895.1 tetratricopeptide repeat protein [Alphaproteobacteria bacterium]MBA4755176.1 tetratricopeptide repeat protein [Sphingobium sp.]MBU0868249.1 tetratricopeptide repeat protein [Alphaproteobacteria bacterium]MBU1796423.1 tetratricopeptide repeat protein [Alphaproteobacteria bacterium]